MSRQDDCQYWGLTRPQCVRYHTRLSRWHATRATQYAEEAQRLARRAVLFAWIGFAGAIVAVLGRVLAAIAS